MTKVPVWGEAKHGDIIYTCEAKPKMEKLFHVCGKANHENISHAQEMQV